MSENNGNYMIVCDLSTEIFCLAIHVQQQIVKL